jgi:hypothetical protein
MRHLTVGFIAALVLAAAPDSRAQVSQTSGAFELRPVVGAFIPTGGMRNDFTDATLYGLQGGLEYSSNVHLLLSGFWSRNTTHFRTLSSRRADIWQFDMGGELNLVRPMGRQWFFRPFVGGGAGARTYDWQDGGVKACVAGYGSTGAEFQRFTGAVRLEARDYVSCFESPVSGSKKTRNDVGLSLGFVYHMM